MVNQSIITGFIIQFIFCIVFPILLAIYWRKRTRASVKAALAGALCFFLFSQIFEGILHSIVLQENSPVMLNDVAYIIYGILAAGIFEETGRFIVFRILKNKEYEKKEAVMFGIGHGGIEAILIIGLTSIWYAVMLINYKNGGIEALIPKGTPSSTAATMKSIIDNLLKVTSSEIVLSILERIIAIFSHIGLSVIVFTSVNSKKIYLFFVAIIMHAVLDIPAAMFQRQILTNNFVVLGLTFVIACGIIYYSVKLYVKS